MKKYLLTQKTVFLWLFLAAQPLMGASSPYNASASASSYSTSASSAPMDDVVLDISFDDVIDTMDTDAGDTDDVAALAAELERMAIGQAVDRRTKSQPTPITVDKRDGDSKKADNSRSHSQPVQLRPSQQQIAAEEAKRAAAQYAKDHPKEAKASDKTQPMVVATATDATLSQANQILVFDEKTPKLMAFTPTFYAPFTPHDSCEFPTVESFLLADNLSGFYFLFYVKMIQAGTLDKLKGIIRDFLPDTIYDANARIARPITRPDDVRSIRRQLLDRTTMPTIKELADVVFEQYLKQQHLNKISLSQDDNSTNNPRLYYALKNQIFCRKELQETLESTGNSILLYRSNNPFFGCGSDGKGANELGKSLMRIREEIRHNDWTPVQITEMQ